MSKQQNAPANQIAALAPSRMPIVGSIAREFDVSADQWRVLVDQIFPSAKTVEAIGMALAYCRARNLDIYKKPVHIVPMYSSALRRMVETVWPGIAEVRTTASRTGNYAGIDEMQFGPMITTEFKGEIDKWDNGNNVGTTPISKTVTYPEWVSVVAYRMVEGQRVGYHAKIYWLETYASIGKTEVPNEMWGKRPRGQAMKCCEAAVLRMAFPEETGNIYTAEEMEGRTLEGAGDVVVIPARAKRLEAPKAPAPEPEPKVSAEQLDIEDFLIGLETVLELPLTEEALEAAWDKEKPEIMLSGDEGNLGRAFAIKKAALERINSGSRPAVIDPDAIPFGQQDLDFGSVS